MNDHENEKHARRRAGEMQVNVCLEELGGVRPSSSLVDRIVAAARRDGADEVRAAAIPKVPSRWLVAACLLVGAGVVGGIAWLRTDGAHGVTAAAPQDPKPQPTEAPRGDGKAGADGQDPKRDEPPKPAPHRPPALIIADYSDNRVFSIDDKGRTFMVLDEVFGVWDADFLPNGNVLLVEFSVSRVREVGENGKIVWQFDDLKNPYCAQRLANGNTLIANTFAGEVLEVNEDKEIVWSYDRDIRPFDAERLANGNTLIADVLGDRVLEVDKDGETVWQVEGLPNVHDADRLPSGNTLVTLRNKGVVQELDKHGKVVWSLTGLTSPSDADRLPDGTTLVAENMRVAAYDQKGERVWARRASWAVEANRIAR